MLSETACGTSKFTVIGTSPSIERTLCRTDLDTGRQGVAAQVKSGQVKSIFISTHTEIINKCFEIKKIERLGRERSSKVIK